MLQVERNPRGAEALYLQALNTCFPNWGDQRMFDWAFRRQVAGPSTDLIMLREGGELIAGSAVTYRTLMKPDGERALIGIMTGSWTLPASRGRGAFSRLIEESVAITREHLGALLLAFVTETNASFRRLEAAGAELFPTRYVSSPPTLPSLTESERLTELPLPDTSWFERFEGSRPAGAHFHYPSMGEWEGQFISRPNTPTLLEAEGGGAALIETHNEFDRLQAICGDTSERRFAIIRAALARAQRRAKRLFLFETSLDRAQRLETQLGLTAARGYLAALIAEPSEASRFLNRAPLHVALSNWALDSGDRM